MKILRFFAYLSLISIVAFFVIAIINPEWGMAMIWYIIWLLAIITTG